MRPRLLWDARTCIDNARRMTATDSPERPVQDGVALAWRVQYRHGSIGDHRRTRQTHRSSPGRPPANPTRRVRAGIFRYVRGGDFSHFCPPFHLNSTRPRRRSFDKGNGTAGLVFGAAATRAGQGRPQFKNGRNAAFRFGPRNWLLESDLKRLRSQWRLHAFLVFPPFLHRHTSRRVTTPETTQRMTKCVVREPCLNCE